MARVADSLLDESRTWIAWTGMETDLIFNQGYDLPDFAAFPMIDDPQGRDRLRDYYARLLDLGAETGVGVILDTPTWMANPDRGALRRYSPDDLVRVNEEAVALVRESQSQMAGGTSLVSLQVGPRGDAYEGGMEGEREAEDYHRPQIEAGARAGADLISAYTLGSAAEAIGVARAAAKAGIPAAISYTVETDGKLPDGMSLDVAVAELEAAESPLAIYVNCAHPDHIAHALDGGPWQNRLRGVVANASRLSHAELDEADELDPGDPAELAQQLADLQERQPSLRVLGGCCGTDLRHLRAIATTVSKIGTGPLLAS